MPNARYAAFPYPGGECTFFCSPKQKDGLAFPQGEAFFASTFVLARILSENRCTLFGMRLCRQALPVDEPQQVGGRARIIERAVMVVQPDVVLPAQGRQAIGLMARIVFAHG